MDQPSMPQGGMQSPGMPSGQPGPSAAPASQAWLTYLLGWLTGLYFFFTTKEKEVKFHAAQSIVTFGGLSVLHILLATLFGRVGWSLSYVVSLVSIALWIILMVKAHKGEHFKLPVVGDLAEQWANK